MIAHLVLGQVKHAQEPAGGCCADEDWAAEVERKANVNSRLRSSGSGESKEGMKAKAQGTGHGHGKIIEDDRTTNEDEGGFVRTHHHRHRILPPNIVQLRR